MRALVRNPGFAAVAILILAIGIGATTAIFSVAKAVLLEPLPYADPDARVLSTLRNSASIDGAAAEANVLGHQLRGIPPDPGAPRTVSPGYLPAMGVRLLEGRWLDEDDRSGQPRVVLVNRAYARRYLAGRSPVGVVLKQGIFPMEVVGLVDDIRMRTLDGVIEPVVFADARQTLSTLGETLRGPSLETLIVGPSGAMSFAVRRARPPVEAASPSSSGMVNRFAAPLLRAQPVRPPVLPQSARAVCPAFSPDVDADVCRWGDG